ncbi:heme/hemin ABC transporter substrate-binding protein [Shewanella pealeana]|uniref:Periplasmic binding protein n=1 Tax=Shewanella pealeana (strain ATCC 700345 / ANG-SQ1) TaxID=398579 RepID=A8H7V9_SHEPA|nr:hemin ABC transporter substrate-binding protein [Shewanella pealeana]ABV88646.1 periplasmic binding protein [Shewanella pealeana ATCC 700345]
MLNKILKQTIASAALCSMLTLSHSALAHDDHTHDKVANKTGAANQTESARVVSAGAGVTELVFALNAGNELVAVDSTSQLPKGHNEVAKLGYHRMLSAEGILALSPNLVLGTDAMGPKATLDVLSGANVKVIQLPDAHTQAQLLSNIDEMGKLLNRENQAKTLQNQVNQSFTKIEKKQQQIAQQGDAPKVLFLLLQADRPARVGGDDTAADIIIKLAGGKNIAGFSGYKSVSQEGILSLQPDVILISNRSDKAIESPIDDLLKQMPLLEHTPAGKNKHIQSLKPQALLGGLGLSAIEAADKLASDFINVNQY